MKKQRSQEAITQDAEKQVRSLSTEELRKVNGGADTGEETGAYRSGVPTFGQPR